MHVHTRLLFLYKFCEENEKCFGNVRDEVGQKLRIICPLFIAVEILSCSKYHVVGGIG